MSQSSLAVRMTRLVNFDYATHQLGDLVQWHHAGPWDAPRIGQVVEIVHRGQTPRLKQFATNAKRRRDRRGVGRFDVSYLVQLPDAAGRRRLFWPDPRRLLPCTDLEVDAKQLAAITSLNQTPSPPSDGKILTRDERKLSLTPRPKE